MEYKDGGYPECVKGPLKKELCAGLDVLDLHPTAAQVSKLTRYLELLEKWNKVYNLTAVRNINDMLVQHIFDCLAMIKPLVNYFDERPVNALDVGSGAGLPAVVIAAMCSNWQVTSVDAVQKKMAFVQQLSVALNMPNIHALHQRVETIQNQKYNLIVSRAFSSLNDFVALTSPLLSDDGVWCAMKGKVPDEELTVLDGSIEVFHVEHIDVPCMDAARCLVWMRKIKS